MSRNDPAADAENFVRESPIDRYHPHHESKTSLGDADYPSNSRSKSFYDEAIARFIDQFCIREIKNRIPLKDLMDTIEKMILVKVLSRFNGRQKAASEFLKIKTTTLHEKLKRHKVSFTKTVQ